MQWLLKGGVLLPNQNLKKQKLFPHHLLKSNKNLCCVNLFIYTWPNAKEQSAIKKAIWNENEKEIRAELEKSAKVRSIVVAHNFLCYSCCTLFGA